MSKITISIALKLISFALSVLPKAVNAILALIDLVDDGCINNSVKRPEWVNLLFEIVDQIRMIGCNLDSVRSSISDTPAVDDPVGLEVNPFASKSE